MKKEAEGSAEAPKTRGRRRVDHTLLRFTSSRRERGVYAYTSDVAFCAHISLRPVLYFLSFSVLPCAFPRLPSRFSRSLLSSVPSPLSPSFFSLALRISFILSPSCPPSPSFVASVVPRASPLLTLRAVFRGSVLLALQSLSSSVLGVPSVLGPDGPIVPRSRLTGLLMAHKDRARGRSLLLCSDRCGDPREERKRKRQPRRNEREESDRYDYYSRGPNNQCGPPAKRPRVPLLLLNHLFFIASSITIAFSYPPLAPYVYAH